MARLFDDASLEYIRGSSAPVTAVPISMSCWFYSDDVTNNQTMIFLGDASQPDRFFLLRLAAAGASVQAVARGDSPAQSASSTTGYTVNTSHHAAARFVTNSSRFAYIDGGSEGPNTTAETPSAIDRVSIGVSDDSTIGAYMSGRIAEAAIWNVDIGAAGVASLAAGMSPLMVRPDGLVFYMPLIRDEDIDIVGGTTMTPFNTPSVAEHPRMIYPSTAYVPTIVAGVAPSGRIMSSLANAGGLAGMGGIAGQGGGLAG